ncbi:MAG: thiol:disulfide interchange protein [Hyphomicrobiaceae bacterium]
MAELRTAGVPVFVDFTAAWCLSCKVNERVALGSDKVWAKFAEQGVVTMKADWTNGDPVITRALANFGRSSVPFYILYHGAEGTEPILLPEIITPTIVLDALARTEVQPT